MDATGIQPSVFFRNCSGLAALIVLLYDHASTFKFEYKHIWKFWFTFLLVSANSLGLAMHAIVMLRSMSSPSSKFRIFVVAVEFILVILTLAKRNVITQYKTIVDKVVRDGGGFFAFTVAVRAPFVNFALMYVCHRALVEELCLTATFSWILSMASLVTCRLIKGFFQLAMQPSTDISRGSNSDIEFTSFIDME
ncbi:hypothetical protein BDQ17DRAFT_1412741 [Cyathus striatus]|nr:hypothetical protein BDQ17DRAFT_1412741 [Cyathus striatus]